MAMKGPGEDGSGGVAFRPGRWANLSSLLKPWERILLSQLSTLGYGSWTVKVLGGVARTQWLTTLTDESPTSSDAVNGFGCRLWR